MTAFMLGLGDDSPPTAMLVATFAGGDPGDYLPHGMTLHFPYGIGAGWAFALLAAFDLLAFTPLTLTNGVINGLVYGLLLLIPAVGWMRVVVGVDADPGQMGTTAVFHAVYGVVLGAFVDAGVLV